MNGGLENLGLTCGINALIQCIAHCSPLAETLQSYQTTGGTLVHELREVVNMISVEQVSVRPRGLVHSIFSKLQNIHEMEQHDISELWMLVADKIADEVGVKYAKPKDKYGICVYNQNNGKDSLWVRQIQGISLNIIQCVACSHRHINLETFAMIAIDVPMQRSVNMADLLVKYVSIEDLQDYTCDKCRSTTCQKQIHLHKLPEVLVITLKRFSMANSELQKVPTPVNIIDNMKIDNMEYRLMAMGNHLGSYHGGHYTATCRHSDGKWYLYDDLQRVETVPQMQNNVSAYTLFYEKVHKK